MVGPLALAAAGLGPADALAQPAAAPGATGASQSSWSYTTVTPTAPVWVESQNVSAPAPAQAAAPSAPSPTPTGVWQSPQPVADAPPQVRRQESTAIVGIGGGARIGFGEPTDAMIYGRLGVPLTPDIAVSVRPAYIFGNADQVGKSNNQGAFQAPITLDLATRSWISPYIGFGIATNTDSNGNTDPMISGGVDIKLLDRLYLALGVNYIFESSDPDNRDIEGLSVLYFRF